MRKMLKHIFIQLITFFLILLSFSIVWCSSNYGNIGLSEIVFTLNMPLEGTSKSYFYSFFFTAVIPTLICFIIELVIYLYKFKKKLSIQIQIKKWKHRIILFPLKGNLFMFLFIWIVWIGAIIMNAEYRYHLFDYIDSRMNASTFIEDNYVDPNDVSITFPEEKQNLICIYIESGESTIQDEANGGILNVNLIPEMTEIAKQNTSFSQSDRIEGACVAPDCGWTIAALVAENSGLPLKLFDQDADAVMDKYATFLPGAVSLGDLLEKEGYHNVFMAGSDFTFGGRTNYFTYHGNYDIWDYYTAIEEGKIDSNYKVNWGFEDQKLYSYAKEKLLELAQADEPFNFSMLTVDTHQGGGYVCDLCSNEFSNDYWNVWRCASSQLSDFVQWIQEQEFYENTTICIFGDHCSMETDFLYGYEYDKHSGSIDRKVYNAILNARIEPVNEINRQFTTLDFYPTILASLGVEIEGDRLGLGTNLFSDKQTLSETYGYDVLFGELARKSVYYDENILYTN